MRERGSDGKGEREWKLERTEEMRQEVQDCVSDTVYQRVRVSLGVSEMECKRTPNSTPYSMCCMRHTVVL